MTATASSFGRLGFSILAVAAAVLTAGCSSLTPHIFSDRATTVPLTSESCRDVSKSVTLDCAYEEAAQVKTRYNVAVRDQGNAQPLLSASLIGLSGLTLFKGITHPNTNDMVGAGVLGSTALAWGNTQMSTPRLAVYRAGIDALSCAMSAVEPLHPGQATLGTLTDGVDAPTLFGRRAAVVTNRNSLQSLLRKHATLNDDTTVDKKGDAGTVTTPPPVRVRDAFSAANEQLTAATQQIDSATELINSMRNAGPLLAKKTLQIQLAVSAEVDKTVPNLSMVMAAAGGLRDVAFTLTGNTAFKPANAQGTATPLALQGEDKLAISAIEKATVALNDARVALSELFKLSVGDDHAQAQVQTQVRQTLNECAFKMSGIKIVITPSTDSVTVRISEKAVFFAFVSGASGIPTATVTGPKEAAVIFQPEGGQFRYEFSPPQGTKAGDKYKLIFAATNGTGSDAVVVQQVVQVVIADAPEATSNSGAQGLQANTGTSDKGKFKDLTKDNLTALGLTDSADEKAIQTAINNCQATATPAITVTANFDAATKKALTDKTCKPGG